MTAYCEVINGVPTRIVVDGDKFSFDEAAQEIARLRARLEMTEHEARRWEGRAHHNLRREGLKYVVAVSQDEANRLSEHGHVTMDEAKTHLNAVQAPPTDPFYASQYKVWEVTDEDAEIAYNAARNA